MHRQFEFMNEKKENVFFSIAFSECKYYDTDQVINIMLNRCKGKFGRVI